MEHLNEESHAFVSERLRSNLLTVRAKTYIPTGKPEMIFMMLFRAMLRKNLITHAARLRARG